MCVSVKEYTPIYNDFKKFLCHDDNKTELFQLIAQSIPDFLSHVSTKMMCTKLKTVTRVWHKKAFFRSSQKIHDVVFFNEKLTYCKTNETVFNQYFQKLGIPQGGNQMSPKL